MTQHYSKEAFMFDTLLCLNKQISTKFERCTGISPSRLRLLLQLYLVDEISQTDLQKKVDIDSAAVTRQLKQLEVAGVVERRNNPDDNRVTLVRLSGVGRKGIVSHMDEKAQFITQMLDGFSEQEQSMLTDMLQRMTNNISEF